MDYEVNFPKSFAVRSLKIYQLVKETIKPFQYDVTLLLNCFLGSLSIVIPNNPVHNHHFLKNKDFTCFDYVSKIEVGENKSFPSFLYQLRNAMAHKTSCNLFTHSNKENLIEQITFVSREMTITLSVTEIEILFEWVCSNVKDSE